MPHKNLETRRAYWRRKQQEHWDIYGVAYRSVENRAYRAMHEERLREYDRGRGHNRRGMSLEEFRRWAYTLKLKSRYRLSRAQYDTMIVASCGYCDICGERPALGLDLDHNHATQQARGLLCRNCNAVIGKFEPYASAILAYLSLGVPIKKPA